MAPTTRSQTVQHDIDAAREEERSQNTRLRKAACSQFSTTTQRKTRTSAPDEPPRFIIDLSLPPEQRYLEVCAAFKGEILNLTPLFDEVVGEELRWLPNALLRGICKALLRRVHDNEENAELKGISKATGVDMYLLVCFNVLLDLFMGCSSGGAVVHTGDSTGIRMVHFRTLDWGMPALRKVVVQLDFIEEKGGPIIASSITYAGFLGVLTGVKRGLSMSLNFRPNRIEGNRWADVKYAWHLLSVLLGRRPSISSTLRSFLLPQKKQKLTPGYGHEGMDSSSYEKIIDALAGRKNASRPIRTTACYLTFSNGKETTTIEKDRISAFSQSSDEFIAITNCDQKPPSSTSSENNDRVPDEFMQAMLDEAQDRQQCAYDNWRKMRSANPREKTPSTLSGEETKSPATVEDVIDLVQRYPTTNECTHFACVMDPIEGAAVWCRRWLEPVCERWKREHS